MCQSKRKMEDDQESDSSEESESETQSSQKERERRKRKKNGTRSKLKAKKLKRKTQKKPMADNDTDSYSEDEDFTDDVQQVSIHQIKMNHYKFRAILERPNPEEKIIMNIIKKHNEQNKKENAPKYEERQIRVFPKMLEVDEDLLSKKDASKPFKIKIFAQVIPKRPAIMAAYGVEEVTSQTCHILIFYYRNREIFVLTTNQAWNVIQSSSDFGFPGKVAARILSRKGALEVTKKGLIGTDFMSKRTHNQIQESSPFDLLSFCTSYTTVIEENASILRLNCFKNQRPKIDHAQDSDSDVESDEPAHCSTSRKHSGKSTKTAKPISTQMKQGHPKTTKVTVSQAGVRFLKRLRPSDLLSILHHLSLISRNKPTQTMDGDNEEDSSAHVQYLQPVQAEVARELDLELAIQFHSAITDNTQMAQLLNYSITHKYFSEFFYGSDFFLKYRQSNAKHWKNSPPTVTQVIHGLRKIERLTDVEADVSEEDYKKILDRCQISYLTSKQSRRGTVQKPEKVLNFVQGMIFRPQDKNVYWHVQGSWFYLQPSYIILIQKDLVNTLGPSLRDSDQMGLKFFWPSSTQEVDESDTDDDDNEEVNQYDPHSGVKKYLKQYQRRSGYFVSSSPGEDIVDMIKIKKVKTIDGDLEKSFILYYIMTSLSHPALAQGVRVTKCLTGLKKSETLETTGTGKSRRRQKVGIGGSEHNLEDLKKLYHQVKTKREFRKIAPTFSEFQKLLSNATVVLGIGTETDSDDARSLVEEINIPTSIEPRHISEKLTSAITNDPSLAGIVGRLDQKLSGPSFNFSSTAIGIHNLMMENDLIGRDNSVTSKLVALSPISVPIPELAEYSMFLNEHVIKTFQPQVATFLGKAELIRIRRRVSKLGIREFIIAEISIEED